MRDSLDRAGLKRGSPKKRGLARCAWDNAGPDVYMLVLVSIRWSWRPYAGPGIHTLCDWKNSLASRCLIFLPCEMRIRVVIIMMIITILTTWLFMRIQHVKGFVKLLGE